MTQDRPVPTERLRTLRDQLVERFTLNELRDLAFGLGARWESLAGETIDAKATSLLEHLNQRLRVPELIARLHEARPGIVWALDDLAEAAEPPYRGLDFYREEDAALFFGRATLTADLVERLRAHPLLVVVGASGSGKSSVVRAGVIPALKGQAALPEGCRAPDGSREWTYLALTPTENPLEQLALALTSDLVTAGETRAIIRDLSEDPASLRLYVHKYLARLGQPRLFLLVDQFEELFTACKDEGQRRAFIAGLLAIVGNDGPATLVITLRADFYHHCAQYEGLRHAVEQRQTYIGAPSAAELREAIVEPARRQGYDLEPGLADLMLRDVGDEPGGLPLLSHALLETWARRDGRLLTLAGYNDAGGVHGAIARTAERIYGEMDEGERETARRILVELAELGEGTEDTRRRVMPDELTGHSWYTGDGAVVLERLVRARLTTADDQTVQIAHEALIREWPRLREWLDVDREGERLRRGVERAAREWYEHNSDPSYLFDGARLAAAQEWAEANPGRLDERATSFLFAGMEQFTARILAKERRDKVVRAIAVALGVVAVVAIAAAWLAMNQRTAAQEQLVRANSQALALTSREVLADDPTLALLLAVEAGLTMQTPEAFNSLIPALMAPGIELLTLPHSKFINQALWNSDESRVLTASADRTAVVWDALNGERLLTLNHEEPVKQAVWNFDESRILTVSNSPDKMVGTTRIWNTTSGKDLVTLQQSGEVTQAKWNPNESRLLTVIILNDGNAVSNKGMAQIWNATTGEALVALQHDGLISQATWNADGNRVLTASYDGTARVWDANTGEKLLVLPNDQTVTNAIWNGDESLILTVDRSAVRVWDTNTGEEVLTLLEDGVHGAKWSPDESYILTISNSFTNKVVGTVRIWDAVTGEALHEFEHFDYVIDAIWNTDGTRVVTGSYDGTAKIWSTRSGEELLTLWNEEIVEKVIWNSEETHILTQSWGGAGTTSTVRIWDARTGIELFKALGEDVGQVSWSEDEHQILFVSSSDNSVRILDAKIEHDWPSLQREDLIGTAIHQVGWNDDESYVLTASRDGTARIHAVDTGEEVLVLHHGAAVNLANWNADESRILTASNDGAVYVWDPVTGEKLLTLKHQSGVSQATWSANESQILTLSWDGLSDADAIRVWDAKTGELLQEIQIGASVNYAMWNENNTRIITATFDGLVQVWDITTGLEVLQLILDGSVRQAMWDGNESRIIATSSGGLARVWDAKTGEELLTLHHADGINEAKWNADQDRILTASDDGTAKIWNAETGKALLTFRHGDSYYEGVEQAIWDNDESRILTASRDETVRVWNALTGEEIFSINVDGSWIGDVDWNADGSRIVVGTGRGQVSTYFTRMEDLVLAACSRLSRNMTWLEWQQYFPTEPYRQTCPNLPVHYTVPEEARP